MRSAWPAVAVAVAVGTGLFAVYYPSERSSQFVLLNDTSNRPNTPVTRVVTIGAQEPPGHRKPCLLRLGVLHNAWRARLEHGPGTVMFGRAADMVADTDGSLLVLDRRSSQVTRVSSDGKTRPLLEEHLPLEYRLNDPHTIVKAGPSTWLISDRSTRLKFFSEQGDRLTPIRTINTGVLADSACLADDEAVIVRGVSDDGETVHMYDISGRLIGKYAPVFDHPSQLARREVSKGLVACSSQLSTVVTLSYAFPLLHGYSRDGRLLWTTEIAGMQLQTLSYGRMDSGAEAVRHGRGLICDIPASLTPLTRDRLLFQFLRVRRSSQSEWVSEVHSVLVAADSGDGEDLGTRLPLVMDASWPRVFAASVTEPPMVGVCEAQR